MLTVAGLHNLIGKVTDVLSTSQGSLGHELVSLTGVLRFSHKAISSARASMPSAILKCAVDAIMDLEYRG